VTLVKKRSVFNFLTRLQVYKIYLKEKRKLVEQIIPLAHEQNRLLIRSKKNCLKNVFLSLLGFFWPVHLVWKTRQLAFSNEGVSLTFKTRFCLQLVLSRQAYVAKISFCHVSTRHAFKIWQDKAKTCDVIKRGVPHS
jgi:hypothetical protein